MARFSPLITGSLSFALLASLLMGPVACNNFICSTTNDTCTGDVLGCSATNQSCMVLCSDLACMQTEVDCGGSSSCTVACGDVDACPQLSLSPPSTFNAGRTVTLDCTGEGTCEEAHVIMPPTGTSTYDITCGNGACTNVALSPSAGWMNILAANGSLVCNSTTSSGTSNCTIAMSPRTIGLSLQCQTNDACASAGGGGNWFVDCSQGGGCDISCPAPGGCSIDYTCFGDTSARLCTTGNCSCPPVCPREEYPTNLSAAGTPIECDPESRRWKNILGPLVLTSDPSEQIVVSGDVILNNDTLVFVEMEDVDALPVIIQGCILPAGSIQVIVNGVDQLSIGEVSQEQIFSYDCQLPNPYFSEIEVIAVDTSQCSTVEGSDLNEPTSWSVLLDVQPDQTCDGDDDDDQQAEVLAIVLGILAPLVVCLILCFMCILLVVALIILSGSSIISGYFMRRRFSKQSSAVRMSLAGEVGQLSDDSRLSDVPITKSELEDSSSTSSSRDGDDGQSSSLSDERSHTSDSDDAESSTSSSFESDGGNSSSSDTIPSTSEI